jgi:hypothetical protein
MSQKHRRTTGTSQRRLVRSACVAAFAILLTTVSVAYATMSDSSGVTATVSTATLAPPANPAVTQSCTPPSTIVLRGATSANGQDTLTIAVPPGTTAGDVLVAQVADRSGTSSGIAAPAGWTLVDRRSGGSSIASAVYWKVATSTEPTTVTFDLRYSSGVPMAGGIVGYSGVSTATPINAWGAATGTGGTATLPSVTTTAPGTMLVHTIAKEQEAMPAPTGTTQRWRIIAGNGAGATGVTGSDAVFAGPGASPARTTATGFSRAWVSHTVALRAAPGTPTAKATWTASPSTWATGYMAERSVGGVVQGAGPVTPVTATSAADGPLVNGTTYTYRLWTYYRSWTSPTVSVTFRPDCP